VSPGSRLWLTWLGVGIDPVAVISNQDSKGRIHVISLFYDENRRERQRIVEAQPG
jgi:hypothetical protein